MEKMFFLIMGVFGIFVTVGYLALGRYALAIVAAVCTAIQFWGAFKKEDNDGTTI